MFNLLLLAQIRWHESEDGPASHVLPLSIIVEYEFKTNWVGMTRHHV